MPEHWNTDDDQGTNDSLKEHPECDRLQKSRPPTLDVLFLLHGAAPQSSGCSSRSRPAASDSGKSIQERPRELLHLLVVGLGQWNHCASTEYAHAQPCMVRCTCPLLERDNRYLTPEFALSQHQVPSIYGREILRPDSFHSIDLNLFHLCSIYRCVSIPTMHVACHCPLYPRRHSCIAL